MRASSNRTKQKSVRGRRRRESAGSRFGNVPRVPAHIVRRIAFIMIGLSVLLSYFLTPLPVAGGITILAVARLWIVRREERREESSTTICPAP